jgi:hypothetical protein
MKAITALAFVSLGLLSAVPHCASAATGFLKGEQAQGLSKICFYDVLGETHTINVSSVSLCPLSRDFDIIPKAREPQRYDSGGKTGFLKGERQQGLSKICYYDVLGETYALNVSSVSLCPLNHRF